MGIGAARRTNPTVAADWKWAAGLAMRPNHAIGISVATGRPIPFYGGHAMVDLWEFARHVGALLVALLLVLAALNAPPAIRAPADTQQTELPRV
jgi:hypothetical protein